MVTKIISIDWIHRSGKNTQLQLLQEKIQQLWYEVFTLRWEYYREWNGENTLTDPESTWRKEHKHSDKYELKSQRLQRELYHFFEKKLPLYCKQHNIHNTVVLLERSIAWKYLFTHWEGEWCDDIDSFQYGHHKKYRQKITIPDLIFVLQPSKEEILRRLHTSQILQHTLPEDQKKRNHMRYTYKIQYIPQKYEKYYEGIELIPSHIRNNIHIITSDENIWEIHKQIREKVNVLLMGNW